MKRLLSGLIGLTILVPAVIAGRAATSVGEVGRSQSKGAPDFGDFPVREVFRGTPAAPLLATPEARRFRTQLSRQAATGPNFAGFYTFARWGCGAGCVTGAIIDARTGQVWFPGFHVQDFMTASGKVALHHGWGFQLDSDLVIAEGLMNERDAGTAYWRWRDGELKLIRFDKLK